MKNLVMVVILAAFGVVLLYMIIGNDASLKSASTELMLRQLEFLSGNQGWKHEKFCNSNCMYDPSYDNGSAIRK